MKATYVIVVLMLGSLIGGLGWVMSQYLKTPATTISDQEAARFTDATKVLYQSNMGEITVEYISNLARVTGGIYDGVVFRQVVAASGAKYEAEKGVTLWTKNNEVRIETPQQVVYTGVAVSPEVAAQSPVTEVIETPEPEISTSTEATSTLVALEGGAWLWQSATAAGSRVTPKKTDAFSITFSVPDSITGTTDCNGFAGSYTKTDTQINLGALRSTLMFCENSEEALFLSLLQSPLLIETLTATTLVVQNEAGDTVSFERNNTSTQ